MTRLASLVLVVHDLHVWSLTTGRYALSAHAVWRSTTTPTTPSWPRWPPSARASSTSST